VYPALAVLQALMNDGMHEKDGDSIRPSAGDLRLLWIGGTGGMEEQLVKQAGIPFEAIPAAGVHGVGWRALPGNSVRLGKGFLAARRILRSFKPDVLFFTGGYVAVPVALAGRIPGRGYPRPRSLLYIPDIEPGLALKSLARFADRIAVTTPGSQAYLNKNDSVVVTGYPTRSGLTNWSPERARQALGLGADLPVLLVFGGSKGSRSINRATWSVLADLLAEVQVLHITGQLDWPEVDSVVHGLSDSLPGELVGRYQPYAFLHEKMGAALAAADLALCRAGASTLGELPLFGLPAILVPYPFAWRYQQVNAQYLADRGAAAIIQDADLPQQLLPVVRDLIRNATKRGQMRSAMLSLAEPDAARLIADQLFDLSAEGGGRL